MKEQPEASLYPTDTDRAANPSSFTAEPSLIHIQAQSQKYRRWIMLLVPSQEVKKVAVTS